MSNVGPETVTSAAEWGGVFGGISKPAKAELATAQAMTKVARLNFMMMTPVKNGLKDRDPSNRMTYMGKRRFHVIPLTLRIDVCLGKSPNGGGSLKIVFSSEK